METSFQVQQFNTLCTELLAVRTGAAELGFVLTGRQINGDVVEVYGDGSFRTVDWATTGGGYVSRKSAA